MKWEKQIVGDEKMGVYSPFERDDQHPRWAAAVRSELSNILASKYFKKAPTIEQLLSYLVVETLKGNGDSLKSYVVGVDGLGKSPEFDPNVDSSPRVQVLRLRKMLEAYYARHAPADDMCIHIPAGSYRVRLARRAVAYPELRLFQRGDDEEGEVATVAGEPADKSSTTENWENPDTSGVSNRLKVAAGAERLEPIWRFAMPLTLLVIVAFVFFDQQRGTTPKQQAAPPAEINSPLLLIERPLVSGNTASQATSDEIYAKLADGIGRFWSVRLQLEERAGASSSAQAAYRLSVQIGEPRSGRSPLYLRLTDNSNSELFWSTTTSIDPATSLSDTVDKSIGELAGPFGVIAARETRGAGGKADPGYRCLLRYIDYLNSRKTARLSLLSECLERPVGIPRLDAVRLGLSSFHTLETAEQKNKDVALRKALGLAQRAIAADPKEAYAHFAMARLYFVSNNCTKGILHTQYASEANPYDPVLLAVLGNFASTCGAPEGDRLLERALQLRSPGESYARLSLILAVIRSGKIDQLTSLSSESENIIGADTAYHHLCETLIAAASGDQRLARKEWRMFSLSTNPDASADQKLSTVVLSQQVRTRIIAYLSIKSVMPPG